MLTFYLPFIYSLRGKAIETSFKLIWELKVEFYPSSSSALGFLIDYGSIAISSTLCNIGTLALHIILTSVNNVFISTSSQYFTPGIFCSMSFAFVSTIPAFRSRFICRVFASPHNRRQGGLHGADLRLGLGHLEFSIYPDKI